MPEISRSPVEDDVSLETLPPHLQARYAAADKRFTRRSPAMTMYLLMKAKHRYALQEQEQLQEELRAVNAELAKQRDEKERALDDLLRTFFGANSEEFAALRAESGAGSRY
ncbi:hypothetical protein DFH07DRAFT_281453 [Mycena maculata]|uniref:Uncharacterized protein n=1 Tax=Mycena maculata TaxID=230809 RepID=A0AAD7NPL4_9AGAR|nr:hypothetical protein DFH07DRAFT_281453 [Mycena maculata]